MKLEDALYKLNDYSFELTTDSDDDEDVIFKYQFENTRLSKTTKFTETRFKAVLHSNIQIIKTDIEDLIAVDNKNDLFTNDKDEILNFDQILDYYIIEGIQIDADSVLTSDFINIMNGTSLNYEDLNRYLITDDIIRILVFCGPSGCGKTFIERKMISSYDIFHKLPQFTTRAMREGEYQGSPYVFINDKTFYQLQDVLIGKVGLNNNLFKAKYGSLSDFRNDKINTLILSEEGMIDFLSLYGDKKEYRIFVLGLDKRTNLPERADRTKEMLDEERKVLNYANYVWSYEKMHGYIDELDVLKILYQNNFLSLNELHTPTQKNAIKLLDAKDNDNNEKTIIRKTSIFK